MEATGQELHDLEMALEASGTAYRAIREEDPPWNGELVAIGLAPASRSYFIKKLMQPYKLIGRQANEEKAGYQETKQSTS